MHSSTSSSDSGVALLAAKSAGRRDVLCAIALLVLVGVALELLGTIGVGRVSRIQHRVNTDYNAAIRVKPAVDGEPTILALGNSLMLEGLNLVEFQKATAIEYRTSTFFVEQTIYTDWYYAIRRLFHAGSRPSVILLGLSVNHIVTEGVLGEYFARYLMDTRDFPSVVRREKLATTPASTLLFANLSGWLGSKTGIRNWLLGRTIGDLGNLGKLLQPPGPAPPDAAHLLQVTSQELVELQQLCAPYSTRLILVIPPTLDIHEPYFAAIEAGAQTGIPVLVPYRPGEMPPQNYRDGFHLNSEGALLFTHRLAAQLLALHAARAAGGGDRQ